MARSPKKAAEPAQSDLFISDTPASDPVVDGEHSLALALAVVARCMADSNRRVVTGKVKVGGAWYRVEVARP